MDHETSQPYWGIFEYFVDEQTGLSLTETSYNIVICNIANNKCSNLSVNNKVTDQTAWMHMHFSVLGQKPSMVLLKKKLHKLFMA